MYEPHHESVCQAPRPDGLLAASPPPTLWPGQTFLLSLPSLHCLAIHSSSRGHFLQELNGRCGGERRLLFFVEFPRVAETYVKLLLCLRGSLTYGNIYGFEVDMIKKRVNLVFSKVLMGVAAPPRPITQSLPRTLAGNGRVKSGHVPPPQPLQPRSRTRRGRGEWQQVRARLPLLPPFPFLLLRLSHTGEKSTGRNVQVEKCTFFSPVVCVYVCIVFHPPPLWPRERRNRRDSAGREWLGAEGREGGEGGG